MLVSINADARLQPIAGDYNQRHRGGRTTYATVDEKVARYAPLPHLVSPAVWDAIAPLVRAAVARTNPPSVDIANRRLGPLSLYVAWCYRVGIPLVDERIFEARLIHRFVADGRPATWSESSLATHRSTLRLIGRAVLGDLEDLTGVDPLPKAGPVAPYTPKEIAGFVSWTNHQPTDALTRGAKTLLAGSRGAGLTRDDFRVLRAHHLVEGDGRLVVVAVGPRPRQVPVLEAWADMLRSVRDQVAPDELLFSQNHTPQSRNLTNRLARRSNGSARPDARRLRVTWQVDHFMLGTPAWELQVMAGVTSRTALERFLGFVPDDVAARVRREIREGPPC